VRRDAMGPGHGGVDGDVAVVGSGGAGLSLVLAIDAAVTARRAEPPRILIVDPQPKLPDRTWCLWDDGGGSLDPLLHRAWTRLQVVDRSGAARILDLSPMRYVMLRSPDVVAAAEAAIARLGAARITAGADRIEDGATAAVVHTGERSLRTRWVFDSRPAPPRRPGSTSLVQRFRGWTVRLPGDPLDPELPTLMDFGVPQPARGVAFVYCLPLDRSRGLVEYTEFVPAAGGSDGPGMDAALRDYLRRRWGHAAGTAEPVVEAVEEGAIPMTDAPFPRRTGRRVFRIGTAGGATRPSTGYTFAAMQRQARAVAAALLDGAEPVPPPPYPARHRWLDAVLLRALDRGYVSGPDLFTRLFDRNPPQRVLAFLDGATAPAQELALMATSPTAPMLRAVAEDAVARAARRLSR
jgi:lycopene beta-cyclase